MFLPPLTRLASRAAGSSRFNRPLCMKERFKTNPLGEQSICETTKSYPKFDLRCPSGYVRGGFGSCKEPTKVGQTAQQAFLFQWPLEIAVTRPLVVPRDEALHIVRMLRQTG